MKKKGIVLILLVILFLPASVLAVSNPYGGLGYGDCTWTAWQLVYERLGICLPGWGGASNWIGGAESSGYATGGTPQANSIVVWSGHVGFVAQVSGDDIYVMEGGYDSSPTGYHEGWYYGGSGATFCGQSLLGYVYLADVPADVTPTAGSTSAAEMAKRNQELAELQVKKASLQNEIEETQAQIDALNVSLAEAEAELSDRMRAMYMMGSDSYIGVLFTSENVADFFTKVDQITQIISAENEAIARVRDNLQELETKQEELQATKAELDEMTI